MQPSSIAMTSTTVPKEFTRGYRPPVQNQDDIPGSQIRLDPPPLDDVTADGLPYKSSGKLEGRAIIVTGADSGIGRSIAILFALEGADLTLAHLPQEEHEARLVEDAVSKKTNGKRRVLLVSADLTDENASQPIIDKHLAFHGHLDTLILNHGTQISQTNLVNMSSDQWHATFNTNIHSFFYLTRAAIPHLRASPTAQPTIVMNASVNMAIGHPELIDYTSTKGAILGFCRALSNQIVGETGIRVNIVAPGPIWTPLIRAYTRDGPIFPFTYMISPVSVPEAARPPGVLLVPSPDVVLHRLDGRGGAWGVGAGAVDDHGTRLTELV